MTSFGDFFVLALVLTLTSVTFLVRVGARWLTNPGSLRRRFSTNGDFGDAMTHMLLADMIRQNRMRLPRATPAFVLSGPQDYPAAFHWLVALFSRRFVERHEWLFSPVIEAAHAAAVFAVTCSLGVQLAWDQPVAMALLSTLVWVATPGFSMEARRGAYLNERVFGFVFTHAFFGGMAMWMLTGSSTFLFMSVVAVVVVSITSKFGMQALVLITPVWALLLGDVRPLAVLAGALLATPVLTLGYSLFVWRGSLRHTVFYATYLARVGDYVTSFSFSQLMDAARYFLRGAIRTAWRRVSAHPMAKGVLNFPSVFVAVGVWSLGGYQVSSESWILVSLCMAAGLVFFVTTTDWLKFLGEGERYLEVAVLTSLWAVLTAVPTQAIQILLALLAYGVVRSLLWWSKHRQTSNDNQAFGEVIDFLGKAPSQLLFCVPGRLSYPICYQLLSHRYLWWFINIAPEPLQERFKRLFSPPGRYPYPMPAAASPAQVGDHEAPTMAVLHRPTIDAIKQAWGIDYGPVGGKIVFENQHYLIRELQPPN